MRERGRLNKNEKMKFFPFMKISIFLFVFFLVARISFAQMSSDSYKINADSLNAGGLESSSASYKLNDTIGEIAAGTGASGTYKMKAGFWEMVNTYLTLTVDDNSKNLGSLLPGSPVTGQSTVTVTTDSWDGYVLNVEKDHPMLHTDTVTEIADHNGTIAVPLLWESPNHLGFGFTLISGTGLDAKWGTNPNYKYAAFPDTAQTAHTKSDYKSTADETVVGYKADVLSSQKSGAYSCTITYTAVGSI